MKEMLKHMLEDKPKKKMGEKDVMAKLDVLKELAEMMTKHAGGEVAKGMQKITVMAKDKEGLLEGLDKAEDVLENTPESEDNDLDKKEMSEDEKEEMLKKLKMRMGE